MYEYSLRKELKNIEDKRRGAGQRHKIDVVLMITIMATMSGYTGFRAIGDFTKRYKKELVGYICLSTVHAPWSNPLLLVGKESISANILEPFTG